MTMTTTPCRRFASILVLLVTFPAMAFAERQARLVGRVVDPEGKVIPDVTVTATSPDIPEFREVTSTDKKGVFKLDFRQINVVYRYRFDKLGYETTQVEQAWNVEGTIRFDFTMQPGETSTLDASSIETTSSPAIQAFNAGVKAFATKDYSAARKSFTEALENDPNLRQAWRALTLVQVEMKNYKEAAEAAEKAIALGSADEPVLRARWEAYRNLGDEVKAVEAREALEKFGRLAEEAKRIHNEGVALSRAGDEEGAFAKFQEALEIDPGLQAARLGLAASALKTNRPAEAAAAAETILETDPQNEQALRIRYNASLELQDEQKIIDSLVHLAAVDSVTARDGLFQLAVAAYDSDDIVKAKGRLDRVLEIDPNHPGSHYYQGLILMREGANQAARKQLERFLQLAPDDPDAATAREILTYLP
jgi:tetratricopeptide (TPR) repeat protein